MSFDGEEDCSIEDSHRFLLSSVPLGPGREESSPDPPPAPSLSLLNTVALCVSLQIGAGLFAAPSQVSQFVPSPGIGVLVWLFGGLLVWTGAATFVELGVAIPVNGGVQEYLRTCYGEYMGFVFAFTWVTITKPASMAIISMVFADYLCSAFTIDPLSPWILKAVGLIGLSLLTFVNCMGATAGAKAANGFFFMKLFALLSIILLGFVSLLIHRNLGVSISPSGWFGPDKAMANEGLWVQCGNVVTALFGALYVYGGWESIGFYLGEVRNPAKTLPAAMNSAMMICVVGFTLMNIALYIALPFEAIRRRSAVAIELGTSMLGKAGGVVYSVVVSASALGSMNSNIFATGRLVAAAGGHQYFPAVFANAHFTPGSDELDYYREKLRWVPSPFLYCVVRFASLTSNLRLQRNVPVYAMVLNLLVAAIYVVMGTFNGLITFVGISEYFFWLLCAVGLLILRRKVSSPGKRLNSSNVSFGYKTWTFNPVIFTCFSSLVVLRGMISDPLQAVAIVGVMGVGWAIWQISKSNSSGSDISRGEYSSLAIDGINATTSTAP